MRTLVALSVFYVVSWAPQIAGFLVAAGLLFLLGQGGMPIVSGLLVLMVAFLGSLAVGLACTLPALARDAGWESGPPNP